MFSRLCTVCSSISSGSSDFWSSNYDRPEYRQKICIMLQSYKGMCKEAERGCQLCSLLLDFPRSTKVEDEEATLFLRRCPAYPDRAVCLGSDLKGTNCFTRTFYRRVPTWWWDLPSSAISREHASFIVNRPAKLNEPVDNIRLMKTWLRSCQKLHKVCSSKTKIFLPTRLLDLRAFQDGPDIRLVDSEPLKALLDKKEMPYPDYLALSHCWGPPTKQPITTRTKDLEKRMQRILAANLPKTFLDAVVIARKLDQRYLWIDSLCIIQDDAKDWAKEAALMADVYGNACCTLAALSSEDGTIGCKLVTDIQKTTGNSFLDFEIRRDSMAHVRMFRQPPTTWSAEYGERPSEQGASVRHNPLRYRAWALQEAELSRRTIFFANKQLLWRCRNLKGTSELPWVEQLPDEVFNKKAWPLCDGLRDDQTEGMFSNIRLRWYCLVEDYSLRSLTHDTDKLPALSGLARDYQSTFPGAHYVAGMWGTHIPHVLLIPESDSPYTRNDPRTRLHVGIAAIGAHCSATLLWRSMDKKACRYTDYIAPTWSWASIKGQISYDSQRIEPHGNSFDRMGVQEELSDCDFGGIQWDGMNAEAKAGDPYGAIKQGAYLTLEGALIARCSVPNKPTFDHFGNSQRTKTIRDSALQQLMRSLPPVEYGAETDGEPLTNERETIGVFFRDTVDDAQLCQGDTFCLRIRGEPSFSITRHNFKSEQEMNFVNMIMGIIIVRTRSHDLGEAYKRVGLARWVDSRVFKDSQPTMLNLV